MTARRTFLQELEDISPANRLVPDRIDTQASHAFAAVEKLYRQIDQNLNEDDAADLKKRFLNSLREPIDKRKFERGVENLRRKMNE
ncbi:hypothetical protein CL653_03455 [bacterium]|nr:hypothetical protein [bacterium]